MRKLTLGILASVLWICAAAVYAQSTAKAQVSSVPLRVGDTRTSHAAYLDFVVGGRNVISFQTNGTIVIDFGGTPETITLSPRQKNLLLRRLADLNASRTANGQGAVSAEQMVKALIIAAVRGEETQAEAHEQAEACAAYLKLTQAKQDAIKAELGGKSPCR